VSKSGITLGPDGDELGADFPHLGIFLCRHHRRHHQSGGCWARNSRDYDTFLSQTAFLARPEYSEYDDETGRADTTVSS
jgi:hypothetical protein